MIAYLLILWILIEMKAPLGLIIVCCVAISTKLYSLAKDVYEIVTERYEWNG